MVPSEQVKADAAASTSRIRNTLYYVKARQPYVDRLVQALRVQADTNHFGEMLVEAMRRNA